MTTKTKLNTKKQTPLLAIAAMMCLVSLAGSNGMPIVSALTDKTLDDGIGCGNQYWGIKSGLPENNYWFFGKGTDCTTILNTYYSRTNVAKLHTDLPGDGSQQFATQWEAIIQGKDPWNNDGSYQNAGKAPITANSNFPITSIGSSYNLKTQWLWTNDVIPQTDSVNANYLTNLWLKNGNSYMVLDFMWEQLKSPSSSPYSWSQNVVTDVDSTDSGVQYYIPYCDKELSADGINTIDVYHYNVVLDNTLHGSGAWNQADVPIGSLIDNALGHTYGTGGNGVSCTNANPGAKSTYQITDVESGIEVAAHGFGKAGRAEGGYSYTELYTP